MKIQIKHKITGSVLFKCDKGSLKLAVEFAVSQKADLSGADLSGAYLSGAYLRGAYLRGAYLSGCKNIFSFTGVGKDMRFGFVLKNDKTFMVQLGCFWGTNKKSLSIIHDF